MRDSETELPLFEVGDVITWRRRGWWVVIDVRHDDEHHETLTLERRKETPEWATRIYKGAEALCAKCGKRIWRTKPHICEAKE